MKRINLLGELERYPVFGLRTLMNIIEKDSSYAKLVLHRLKKDKLIFEIEKNKYTTNSDSFAIASHIIWPCYISFWSAVNYYHLTEQIPHVVEIITTRARKEREISFGNTKITFTRVKPKYFFGYKKERYHDFYIFIAEREKALIDSALFKKISFSEIIDSLKDNINEINTGLLVKYMVRIGNKALIKRFGFALDKLGINKYKQLKKFIDYKYVPLDYAMKAKGKRNKKWKVMENAGS